MKHNHLAIWIVAFVLQLAGAIWYSNWAFGPIWFSALGKDPSTPFTSDPVPYIISLTSSVIICYGASWLIRFLDIKNIFRAVGTSLFISFFFFLPVLFTHYAFLKINYIATLVDWGMSTTLLTFAFVALSFFKKDNLVIDNKDVVKPQEKNTD